MSLAHSIDPVDVLLIAVPLLVYSLAFLSVFAVVKIRERQWQASHRKRLDQLRGHPWEAP
jgi:hypothetical protein